MIDWSEIERTFSSSFTSRRGRPASPHRLIAGQLYLQHAFDASGEAVINTWVENAYWQHFTGEVHLQTVIVNPVVASLFAIMLPFSSSETASIFAFFGDMLIRIQARNENRLSISCGPSPTFRASVLYCLVDRWHASRIMSCRGQHDALPGR